jgi:hypothetical protein
MYHSVCLHNGRDRPKRYFVHRLVCEAFNGPPPQGEKRIVAHNDGDWRNNYYANLRWATYLENSADAKAHGRTCKGTRNKIAKLNDDKVREIRSAEGVTQRELARRFGVSQSQIWMVRSRKSWRHL